MKKQLTEDLFRAYYDARRNKRNKKDVVKFEVNYERNLFVLAEEILDGKYQPGVSSCFIVKKPVKREIFAASFRDRIVHHLIYNYINPLFERSFINDSYSCRIGKGTSYGIKRLNHFIRSCSENYQKDCYILKLDIKGYFMSINKNILHEKIKETLNTARERERERERESNFSVCRTKYFDYKLIHDLIEKTIFYNPIKNCAVKGKGEDWAGLPKSKSLFFTQAGCGLPIGNLTSQLFGNIYLNEFDHYAKRKLKIKYYGRYVDDMVFVHRDKEYLKSIIPQIRNYLKKNLALSLNEKKQFLAGMNSYLGIMSHYDTAKLRQKMLGCLSVYFWNYFYNEKGFLKKRSRQHYDQSIDKA